MLKGLCRGVGVWILLLPLASPYAYGDAIGDIIQQSKSEPTVTPAPEPPAKQEDAEERAALPKRTIIPKIVIDPGHGGKDSGAIGYRQIREKDVVLEIAKKLARQLKDKMGANVIMTRDTDTFISLDKRDQVAIEEEADLFLSIHANAASRQEASGVEIYYLNNASDEAAQRLANRENRGSRKSRTAMEEILSNIVLNDSTAFSRILAEHLQDSIKGELATPYKMRRFDIRSALFYVLVGSKAPSILLEVGFVTNPEEAKRLKKSEYQDQLVESIVDGIDDYFKMLKSKKWMM